MDHIALVAENDGLVLVDGPAATYFEALANVRSYFQSMRRNSPGRTDDEKLEALAVFNDLMATAQAAAAEIGLPDFHMGHVLGTH